jgi:hypothetical protein
LTAATVLRSRLCRAGPIAALIAVAATLALFGCNKQPERFIIALPDVTFSVGYDWVAPHIRVQSKTWFPIAIPIRELPKSAAALRKEIWSGEYALKVDQRTLHMTVEYRATPVPGGRLSGVLKYEKGASLLPDDPALEYRIAVRPSGAAGTNGLQVEYYEWKKDTRYVISCTTLGKKVPVTCGLYVPYREFHGEKCTQMSVDFPKDEMHRWQAIAEQQRETLRQFETTQPNQGK